VNKEQKWPNELLIIRHGQSERNVLKAAAKREGKTINYSDGVRDQDAALTYTGSQQAEAVGKELAHRYPLSSNPLHSMVVSPYLRTRQTAQRIQYGLGYPVKSIIEERIREIEFGILDGLTAEGIKAKYPEEVERRKKEGKYWYRAPGGESRPDVRLRIHSFLDTLTRDYVQQNVVVVCHSVVVLAFRSLLERWGEDEYIQVDKENDVKNCAITRYVYNPANGRLELAEYNTICYEEFSNAQKVVS
jgi:broad specificity phosphatase PhoE